jgi:hypothetical protein
MHFKRRFMSLIIHFYYYLNFSISKNQSGNCNNLIFGLRTFIRMGMVFIYKQSLIFLFDYPA